MKKIMMTALIAMASGSLAIAQNHDNDNDKNKIEGSGHVVTKERPVQSFDEINASGVFHLVLTQGSKEEVKIEADDNLQELFEVKTEGGKLIISMKKNQNFNSNGKLKVYVTFRKIKTLDLKMVGGATNEGQLSFDDLTLNNKSVGNVSLNLSVKKLTIDNKSVGNVKLSGKAEHVNIQNKSVGNISAADFVVQNMDISNDGIGSAEVNVEKEVTVKDTFLGKVKNKGAGTVKKLNRTSSR